MLVVVVVVRGVPVTVVDVVHMVVMLDGFVTARLPVLVVLNRVMLDVGGVGGHIRDAVQEATAAERGFAFAYATMLAA